MMKSLSVCIVAAAGLATSAQAQRMFDSGPTCTSLNVATQLPTLVGFSSGNLVSAAAPQRWMAQPFTFASQTQITEIGVNGFDPADVGQTSLLGYDNLKWIIWTRLPGNPAPLDGQQLHTGTVTTASVNPGQPDPRGYFSNQMLFKIPVNLTLPAGNYWLTVYGSDPNASGTGDANFAWFSNAQLNTQLVPPNTPIPISDPQGVFVWRSVSFPAPGFQRYTAAPTAFVPDPAPTAGPNPQDPQYFYSASFYLAQACRVNCDNSTIAPCLNVNDFVCFLNEFNAALTLPAAEQQFSYANIDRSSTDPFLNVNDFISFNNQYASGCALPCANRLP